MDKCISRNPVSFIAFSWFTQLLKKDVMCKENITRDTIYIFILNWTSNITCGFPKLFWNKTGNIIKSFVWTCGIPDLVAEPSPNIEYVLTSTNN